MKRLSNHLTFEVLTELADGRLARVGEESLHLDECRECSETLDQLEHTFTLMRTDNAADAPRDVLFHAISLFQRVPTPSLARRIMAVLSFDSLSSRPAFGTRSGATEVRQLIYSAEQNDIDLHISAEDNKWVIAGQLLSESCTDGEAVIEGNNLSLSAKLNESCEFKLPAIPSGDYKLRLRFSDMEVEVPRIELRK
jgi:hypothetical protein